MLEFMVNHISPGSAEFKDFKEHGAKSKFADLFVSWERIWGKRNRHASASRRRAADADADAAPCMSSMRGACFKANGGCVYLCADMIPELSTSRNPSSVCK